MKYRIKSWEKMVREFGVDEDGDVNIYGTRNCFYIEAKHLCGMEIESNDCEVEGWPIKPWMCEEIESYEMTDEEKLQFWQENKGKEVELSDDKEFKNYHHGSLDILRIGLDYSFYSYFLTSSYKYARKIQEKTRFMTVEELADKWITFGTVENILQITTVYRDGSFWVGEKIFKSVEELHGEGGKWADKPNFDDLKSLEVEA